LWVLLIGAVITFVVLALTVSPSTNTLSERIKVRKQVVQCTQDELFDDQLSMCAPIINTPIPILDSMVDHGVSRCHSFYHHMCGNWIKNHTNEDRAFTYVYVKNQKEAAKLIQDTASGPVYKFYRSCLDTLVYKQHRQQTNRQIQHVTEYILDALQTHADLPVVFARLAKYGYNGVFSITIEPHPTEPRMIPLFRPDTVPGHVSDLTKQLNMWHLNTDTADDDSYVDYVKKGKFHAHTASMKYLIDLARPNENFWRQFLRELNGVSALENDLILNDGHQDVWILDKQYFEHLFANLDKVSLEQWRDFVQASITYNTHEFMPVVPSDSYFRLHEKNPVRHLTHITKHTDKERFTEAECIRVTQRLLPGLVAQDFLARFMPKHERIREKVTKMVENLRTAFVHLIHETEWLSPETRAASIEKIQSIIVRAVHPNTWETEPFAGRITMDGYLRNLNMIRRYRAQRNFELWLLSRAKLDRDIIQRFGAPLTTVNAYYSPVTNTITVFAGIVQEPFYSEAYADVALYATLGMICGHELSHALDPMGREFDKNGSIRQWWGDKDIAAFRKKAECVVREYDPPHGCENAHYGEQTLGEDIADITGLALAWRAFKMAHPESSVREEQQFFKIFTQMWAESFDQEHLCGRVSSDVHAIAEYRVDKTLQQFPDFAKIFHCSAQTEMYSPHPCQIYGSKL